MSLNPRLQARVFDANLSTPVLLEEITERVSGLQFSTALHGGFKTATFTLPLSLADSWLYLAEAGRKGRHFNRLLISEEQRVIWEGRIMEVTLRISAQFRGLAVTALGYWNACRDQRYDAADHTDWTIGGPHTVDDIIKEMLTEECPDINTDQANIAANSRDVVGIDLTDRDYPQNIIVEKLAPLSDSDQSIWHFAIWDNRKPYWVKRAITTVDWYVWLRDIENLRLSQTAMDLRNAIMPDVDGTEGTVQTNAASLLIYPRREMPLTLPTGSNANTQADAAQLQAAERGNPHQTQDFSINGRIYDANGTEISKWRVRAGDVIRLQDLVPLTKSSPSFDALRTFYILETSYDADKDILSIQPDIFSRTLSALLPRLGTVERNK